MSSRASRSCLLPPEGGSHGRSHLGLVFVALVALLVTACGGASSPTAPSAPSISVPDPSTLSSITYSGNVQPILASDCVPCHNASVRNGGYDLSTYAGVMQAVVPGNPQSRLVIVTQPGGLMYRQFGATPDAKAATIRRWVLDFNAAQ